MTSDSPIKPDLKSWIVSLGFERGNPFATVEADQERILLPQYFVDVDGYEQIKGDKTIIVFAPRGGGKSALRVVLASNACPTLPEAKSLAVEYTDFAQLIAKLRNGQEITIEDHANQLLHLAVGTLFTALCGELPSRVSHSHEIREPRTRKVKEILPHIRARIARWVRTYQPQCLEPDELYERLNALDSAFRPEWDKFRNCVATHKLQNLLSQASLGKNEIALFLADLNDFSSENVSTQLTPKERFLDFLAMTRSLGFITTQFLVDRLDESEETANDPQKQVNILESLVAELPILELPGLAFKFFISHDAHNLMLERPTIRRDRIIDQAVTVNWSKERLKHLLDERLNFFSKGTVYDLLQICQGTQIESQGTMSSHLVGQQIEEEMLNLAQGSPRRLVLAGQLLLEAHSIRAAASELIEWEDWQKAKGNLFRKMPPLLRIYREDRVAFVGERRIDLTGLRHKILLALASANGICDRPQLISEAWGVGAGVSDEAIDRQVSRIRDLLQDNADDSVYIKTIRDKGFELMNYEII